ncbi:MAG TPA: sigma-70 family RNA polymerase sigma factor [Polyangiaceae bacterium]|nr:sigma-70 family RNA polymerase sigma factor [Polyangiaceae bacterium]
MSDRSDDELMTLGQADLREAFDILVERHGERLVRTCARFVDDPDEAAELAQETWVAVWSQRAHYRPDGKFVVWLISAARNRCRNQLRHDGIVRRHRDAARVLTAGEVSPSEIDRLLVEERRHRVHRALSRIPERMRDALLLRFGEELRYDEMAVVLRVRESTLRARVHHGLALLHRLLDRGESER